MKIIAFLGSPRKDGNTELLLREEIRWVENSGSDVKVFDLNSMNIRPCQDCGGCNETGECIKNDEKDHIHDAIKHPDRVIIASPILLFSISAQTKAMIDRCQSFWCEKYVLKRPIPEGKFGRKGLLLLVGGMKKNIGVECSEACTAAFFRTISISEHRTLSFLGIDEKGEIRQHPTALQEAFEAGKKLVAV